MRVVRELLCSVKGVLGRLQQTLYAPQCLGNQERRSNVISIAVSQWTGTQGVYVLAHSVHVHSSRRLAACCTH